MDLTLQDNRNDYFCWLCHKEGTLICCELCPRVYHTKCLGLGSELPQDWACPECEVRNLQIISGSLYGPMLILYKLLCDRFNDQTGQIHRCPHEES